MNVGSLFAGIGGFDLGLERAGMHTVWQVEQEPFRRAVLARHFPDAKRFEDVREVGAHNLEWVDVICGGFPCQDLSLAGKGAGINGARSGLWSEYVRIVGELRPRYVIVENVPALLGRGMGRVLGDLAALGYDAEWDCLPASAFGAPHRRDRVWLVAYPTGQGRGLTGSAGRSGEAGAGALNGTAGADGFAGHLADPHPNRRAQGLRESTGREQRSRPGHAIGDSPEQTGIADPDGRRRETGKPHLPPRQSDAEGSGGHLADATSAGQLREVELENHREGERGGRRPDPEPSGPLPGGDQDSDERALQPWRVGGRATQAGGPEWWSVEPPVGRVAHGVPDRLDQLAALGDALVPQIAEWIGTHILSHEQAVLQGSRMTFNSSHREGRQ